MLLQIHHGFLLLWLVLSAAKAISSSSNTSSTDRYNADLWQPVDGTREEWLRCHGQPCDQWERVKKKMAEIKMSALHGVLGFDGDHGKPSALDAENANNLDGCTWLTEEQCDEILDSLQQGTHLDSNHTDSHDRYRRQVDAKAFRRWSLPIVWKFDGTHTPYQKSVIRSALEHWTNHTCIDFREVATHEEFTDNHLLFTRNYSGCYSYIGRVPYIPQQLNLQSGCFYEFGIPVHEIGHSLGLWHEQQRSDRDDTIRVLWENIDSHMGQFYKHKTLNLVPYDTGSVMHYGPMDGAKQFQKKPVMESLDPSYQHNMGQRVGISFLDAKAINMAYCKDRCINKPLPRPCKRNGYQDPRSCTKCLCPEGFSGPYCEELAPSNTVCGGVLNVDENPQIFHSPGYFDPQYYELRVECNWLIKAMPGYRVEMRFVGDFGVYKHYKQQCYHWVEVRRSANLGVQGGRYCGKKTPTDVILSTTNEMLVIFRSNFTVSWPPSKRGFKATVMAVPVSSDPSISSTPATTVSSTVQTATTSSDSVSTKPTTMSTSVQVYTTLPPLPSSTTLSTTPNTILAGCQQLDLAFILGGTIVKDDWFKVLHYVINIVSHFTIGHDMVRVAIVSYAKSATLHFNLGQHFSSDSLVQAIYNVWPRDNAINTADALRLTRHSIFSYSDGDRRHVRNVVVLVTGDASTLSSKQAISEVKAAKHSGIVVCIVSIGKQLDDIYRTVSKPEDIILVSDFEKLLSSYYVNSIVTRICSQKTTATKLIWHCDFEGNQKQGSLCGMSQLIDDQFNWTLTNGKTPSGKTGPQSASQGEFYIYIETSRPRHPGDTAIIVLPDMPSAGEFCLTFYYHMYGHHVDHLILTKMETSTSMHTLWSKTKNQGNVWHLARVAVKLDTNDQLAFIGIRGKEYSGDIALDQIQMFEGSCESDSDDNDIMHVASNVLSSIDIETLRKLNTSLSGDVTGNMTSHGKEPNGGRQNESNLYCLLIFVFVLFCFTDHLRETL